MIVTISTKEESNSNKDLRVVNSWSFQNMSKNEKKILVKKGFFTCTYNTTVCYTRQAQVTTLHTKHSRTYAADKKLQFYRAVITNMLKNQKKSLSKGFLSQWATASTGQYTKHSRTYTLYS